MARRIVGIVGGVGAGRRTIVRRLIQAHGFEAVGIIDRVRAMLAAGFDLTEDELLGEGTNRPLADFGGVTPRHLETTLAHEWARRLVHTDVWCVLWSRTAAKRPDDDMVVPDIRFPNEAMAVRAAGGLIWKAEHVENGARGRDGDRWTQMIPCDRVIQTGDSPEAIQAVVDAGLRADFD